MSITAVRVEPVVRANGVKYTVIVVKSESNPNKTYRVDVTNRRCSCPGWTMHKNRDCKHLRALDL